MYRIIEVGLEAPIQRAGRVVATPFILILVNPMSSLINIQKATNDVNTLPLQSDVIRARGCAMIRFDSLEQI